MIPSSRPKLSDLYTLSQSKLLQNHTVHSGTYLYSPYMPVPPTPGTLSIKFNTELTQNSNILTAHHCSPFKGLILSCSILTVLRLTWKLLIVMLTCHPPVRHRETLPTRLINLSSKVQVVKDVECLYLGCQRCEFSLKIAS